MVLCTTFGGLNEGYAYFLTLLCLGNSPVFVFHMWCQGWHNLFMILPICLKRVQICLRYKPSWPLASYLSAAS